MPPSPPGARPTALNRSATNAAAASSPFVPAPRPSIDGAVSVATVSVGYADGYMRALSGKAHAAIGGVRVPMTGRVSMDLLTFDITELAPGSVQEGQYLDLIGPSVTVGELARQGGTIGYEILTRLGSRLARRYRKGADVFDIQHSSVTPTAKADSSR